MILLTAVWIKPLFCQTEGTLSINPGSELFNDLVNKTVDSVWYDPVERVNAGCPRENRLLYSGKKSIQI
ncbi:MAG: hypothetical protein BMS9Abin02_1742 [Anaerolineae bacterium]|nr:MAG: hypothetical protein BMS9Abin02_1742 [Anaerolineae bacterium]